MVGGTWPIGATSHIGLGTTWCHLPKGRINGLQTRSDRFFTPIDRRSCILLRRKSQGVSAIRPIMARGGRVSGASPETCEVRAVNHLRAIIRSSSDAKWFEAQLLELDIAVAAESKEAVFREIEYALVLEYQIARERVQTPFARLVCSKTPHSFHSLWAGADSYTPRSLNIPDEVWDALAIALHTPKRPVFAVQQYAMAA